MRICYFQADYISHFRAATAYCECLATSGNTLVEHPSSADLVIIHNEPWTVPSYYRAFPELNKKYVVAYSVWEASVLPDYYRLCLGLINEIWTASSYSHDIFRKHFSKVFVVPHVVTPPILDVPTIEHLETRIKYQDDMFYFYTVTNAADPRKNVKTLVGAFESLSASNKARLLVKTHSPLPPDLSKVPGVIPLYGESNDKEIEALHHLGHCFVSAHCSEAWGMGISEAMSHSKIVIATGFGGNMDYMNGENSLPVKFTVEHIRKEALNAMPSWLRPEMQWAYVDEDDLRAKMATCLTKSDSFQSMSRKAQQEMRRFSPESVAQLLLHRLDAIRRR